MDGGKEKSGMDAKGTHFTCFTSTTVQILTQLMLGATCHASDSTKSAQQFEDFMQAMLVLYGKVLTLPVYSVLSLLSVLILLHAGDARALWQGIQSTSFTSTKVQILTVWRQSQMVSDLTEKDEAVIPEEPDVASVFVLWC